MKNKVITITFIALFIISLVGNTVQLYKNKKNNNIIGTYSTNDESAPVDQEYFVFTESGEYYRYVQFKMLEQGNFDTDQANIYRLHNTDDSNITKIVHINNLLYYFSTDDVVIYSKISNEPTFLNLNQYDLETS